MNNAPYTNTGVPDYSKEKGRLNRISGQIEGIKKMIGEQRECKDILSQLRAVRAAIRSVETDMLQTYLEYCMNDAFLTASENDRLEKIAEIGKLYVKYSE